MKATHIVPRIHEEASGPTYSVTSLCNALAQCHIDVTLRVTHSAGQAPSSYRLESHGSLDPGGYFGFSPQLKRALAEDSLEAQIIHNHSLWMMPNIYPGTIDRPESCKLVCSPRGTMSDWAWNRSRWKKRIAGMAGQSKMLQSCDCFHATAEHEALDIRRRGFKQPIAVIPNGVDCPTIRPRKESPSKFRKLLYLARIHPVKGLDLLLNAWATLASEFPSWELLVAGPLDSKYARLIQEYARGFPRVTFLDNVAGAEKERLLNSADLYVLPSKSENFGQSVAEALSYGVPAVVCEGAPWRGLIDNGAGWWIPQTSQDVLTKLGEAMSLSLPELRAMGGRGRKWMEQDFAWESIANKMKSTYQWLLGNTSKKPDWVFTD